MINLRKINPAREITMGGMHSLYGTATGDIVCQVQDSNGKEHTAHIPIVLVPGIGKHLFSSGSAKSRGIKTIIDDSPRLEKSNIHFPMREDGRLFKIDMKVLPWKASSQQHLALVASDEESGKGQLRLGHLNETRKKTRRTKHGASVKSQDALEPRQTSKLRKSAQQDHPRKSTVETASSFETVYTDITGPSTTRANESSRYNQHYRTTNNVSSPCGKLLLIFLLCLFFEKGADLSGLRPIRARAFMHSERSGNKHEKNAWEDITLGHNKDSETTAHRPLKGTDRDKLSCSNVGKDKMDKGLHQDILAQLSPLDVNADGTRDYDDSGGTPCGRKTSHGDIYHHQDIVSIDSTENDRLASSKLQRMQHKMADYDTSEQEDQAIAYIGFKASTDTACNIEATDGRVHPRTSHKLGEHMAH